MTVKGLKRNEFFRSLSLLCSYYNIARPDLADTIFPQNIYKAWQQTCDRLQEIDKQLQCFIIADDKRQAVLATAKPFQLNGLYYIPIRVYCEMAAAAETQAEAEILLRLFAYLHQQAGLPFFQESGSFMDYNYDTLENWLIDAEAEDDDKQEKEWQQERLGYLYEIRQAGAKLMPLLQSPVLMNNITAVVRENAPKVNPVLGAIAERFEELYKAYRERTIYDNIHTDLLYPDEDETLRPDQYTGFYCSPYDCFAAELDEMINCAFQEVAVTEEPAALKIFDRSSEADEDALSYERLLYSLSTN